MGRIIKKGKCESLTLKTPQLTVRWAIEVEFLENISFLRKVG